MLKDIDLHARVQPIIKKVGQLQLSYFTKVKPLNSRKKDGAGIVTEADIESEKILIKELSQVVPEADFFAEESGISGNGDYRWVIDPLDGTTNFSRGLPHFCISVALTYKNEPIFAMIYQPILNETFWAERGKGAWLNGKKIQVAKPDSFEKSILLVSLPYQGVKRESFWNKVFSVLPKPYSFRHLGAAALDLAYVACGRFDGVFFAGLEWWDYAAGDLIIREAGGKTSDFEGNPVRFDSPTFMAGGEAVYNALQKLLGS